MSGNQPNDIKTEVVINPLLPYVLRSINDVSGGKYNLNISTKIIYLCKSPDEYVYT